MRNDRGASTGPCARRARHVHIARYQGLRHAGHVAPFRPIILICGRNAELAGRNATAGQWHVEHATAAAQAPRQGGATSRTCITGGMRRRVPRCQSNRAHRVLFARLVHPGQGASCPTRPPCPSWSNRHPRHAPIVHPGHVSNSHTSTHCRLSCGGASLGSPNNRSINAMRHIASRQKGLGALGVFPLVVALTALTSWVVSSTRKRGLKWPA